MPEATQETRARTTSWAAKATVYSLIAVIGLLFCLVFVVPVFVPWTRLHCTDESIDITCGRYRFQRYVLCVRVTDRVEETPLSRSYRELVGVPPEPVWHLVNTFSPGVSSSPHYRYHGALAAASLMQEAFGAIRFTKEAQRAAILTFFDLLQDDGDWRAKNYAFALWSQALNLRGRGDSEIGIQQLPAASESRQAPTSSGPVDDAAGTR